MGAYLCCEEVDQMGGLLDGLFFHFVLLYQLVHEELVRRPRVAQNPIGTLTHLFYWLVHVDGHPILASIIDKIDVVFEVHVVYPHE